MNRDLVQYYIKKPLVIKAIQFNGVNVELIREFTGGKLSAFHRKNNKFYVNTREGLMLVKPSDYIVRGIAGEFYPVAEHIFDASYVMTGVPQNGDAETQA